MSSVCYPAINLLAVRLTSLDSCGRPAYGDTTQAVTDGVVSVAVTANYDDGTEISITNGQGRKCVKKNAEPELLGLSITALFCNVQPELYSKATGAPIIYDPQTGDAIGYDTDGAVRPGNVNWALEGWQEAQSSEGCGDDDEIPYAYALWPWLQGGKVGDYTLENNAVTFSVSAATSKDGSQWDVGPYLVATDDAGDPSALTTAVGAKTYQRLFRTTIAPPASFCGALPLDDPDNAAATGATAGSPGVWTPAGSVRPATLAALVTANPTASPATAWTVGQYVIVGDGSHAKWSGTAWVAA